MIKKKYAFISMLLAGSMVFSGCEKRNSPKETGPEITQASSRENIPPEAEQDSKEKSTVLSTEKVAETPVPTEADISMKQGYGDANREIAVIGLKEYKQIKGKQYTDKAKKGKKYLVLFLKVHNRKNDKDYFHVDYLEASVDGKKVENTFLLNEPENYQTIFTNIPAETIQKGFIVWEVPADWKKLEITYNGWQGSDGVSLHARFGKKDLKEPEKF